MGLMEVMKKRWLQWLAFFVFHGVGIYFMALSIGHWGMPPFSKEMTNIAISVASLSVSITIWYKYKLRLLKDR